MNTLKSELIGKTFTRRDYVDPNGQQSVWYTWQIDDVEFSNKFVDLISQGKCIYRFNNSSFTHYLKTGIVCKTSYLDDSTYTIH